MTFGFFGTHSQATTAESEEIPSQEKIESEIAKLKEDSARDVQRQLAQQRLSAKEHEKEEDVKKVVEDVEKVWRAAEKGVETIIKDTEVDVEGTGKLQGRVETAEGK